MTDVLAPRGLNGVVVTETVLGDVRGLEGFYHYRQYSAPELAARFPVEDVWRLVIDGALPATLDERATFAAEARAGRHLPPGVAAVLPAIATASSSVMEALRTAVSLTASARGLRPIHDLDLAGVRSDVIGLAAAVPVLTAALWRAREGLPAMEVRDDLGHGAHLLWLLHGVEPDPERARALEQYLVLTIDHGFNASTFALRVIASTGSDAGACFTGALGALAGPLHGGAPSRVLDTLDEIEAAGGERLEAILAAKLDGRERLMGFGHGVYRTTDPRSTLLAEVARRLGGPRVALCERLQEVAERLLAERHPERPLQANVELFASVVLEACGLPRELFTPAFACSRVAGLGRPRRRAGGRAQAHPPERPLRRPARPRPDPRSLLVP